MFAPDPSARRHGDSHRHHSKKKHRRSSVSFATSDEDSSGTIKLPSKTSTQISPWIKAAAFGGIVVSMVALVVGLVTVFQVMNRPDDEQFERSLYDKQIQMNDLLKTNSLLRRNFSEISKQLLEEQNKHHNIMQEHLKMQDHLDSLLRFKAKKADGDSSILEENIRLKKNLTRILNLIRKNNANSIKQTSGLMGNISHLQKKLTETHQKASANDIRISKFLAKRSCKELQVIVGKRSGVYEILIGNEIEEVFCDMRTDGGGWMIIQKRDGGIVDFYQDFETYVTGFGNKYQEYWLGLEKLNKLTKSEKYELRIDLQDWQGNRSHAKYEKFFIGDRGTNYKLMISDYSGNAGDALDYHNNRPFSAKNRDNDAQLTSNCALDYHGAWWYGGCHTSNLNGEYLRGGQIREGGINWWFWKRNWYSMKVSEMKIRPV